MLQFIVGGVLGFLVATIGVNGLVAHAEQGADSAKVAIHKATK